MSDLSLGRALAASLQLRYQPIVSLTDGRPSHVEVLARADAADGSLPGPGPIVRAMDQVEDALSLTAAIMQLALTEFRALGLDQNGPALAFNLPLNALLHPTLPGLIETTRQRFGLGPGQMRFELTENQPVSQLEAVASAIQLLHGAGHALALDDITPTTPFLTALIGMPIRSIKLDRSVVTNPTPRHLDFMRSICPRALINGKEIVAEGIESDAQKHAMKAAGVTQGQGYLFCRPLRASALAAWLSAKPTHF